MGQHLDAFAARLAIHKARREFDQLPLRVVKSQLRRAMAEAIIADLKIPVLAHTLRRVIWLVFRHRKLNVVTSFADHDVQAAKAQKPWRPTLPLANKIRKGTFHENRRSCPYHEYAS